MYRELLLAGQNPDGGWPYSRGPSRIEPTIFALLALGQEREGANRPAAARARGWVRTNQRPDGGWAPAPLVQESTWVTALPLLLSADALEAESRARALRWLLGQSGAESGWMHRLRQVLLGQPVDEAAAGWPWFPGAAAWVMPTALTILALRQAAPGHPRIAEGCRYLLAHRCSDGGWNHGAPRALGYDSASYPETTGLALLAVPRAPDLRRSIDTAMQHLYRTRSAEGLAWLHLGLRAHGCDPGPWPAAALRPRNLRDVALCRMASVGYGAVAG